VGFAHPRRPQEDDIFSLVDEVQFGQFPDLLRVNRGLEAEVKVGQGLREGEVGQADAAEGGALIAGVDLRFQQLRQEVGVAQLGFGGVLGDGREHLFHPVQFEALQVAVQAFLGGRHADISSATAA
jgi:hypothetical protein